jgi:hypothetical protein
MTMRSPRRRRSRRSDGFDMKLYTNTGILLWHKGLGFAVAAQKLIGMNRTNVMAW